MHLEDERLYLLLDRYLAGEASAADAQAVREWLAADAEHALLLDDLRLIKRVIADKPPHSSTNAAWAKALKALEVARPAQPRVPQRLLRVHTAGSVTEDLGTAFVIRAYADQIATEVVVAEGRVALWRARPDTIAVEAPPALVLGARDLGQLRASGDATLRRGVDVDRQLAWTRGVLAFDGTPLREAVRTLGRWYDVEIRLDDADSALAGRRFTATFTNEPIDLVLQRIALTLGLRVERADGSVFLLRNDR